LPEISEHKFSIHPFSPNRQTGLGEEILHRMLSRKSNPTARNPGVIVRSIAEDLGIKPRVEVAA
jgi:hypothetical protein